MATKYSGEFVGTLTDAGSGLWQRCPVSVDPNTTTTFYDDFIVKDWSTTAGASKWTVTSTATAGTVALNLALASTAVGGKIGISTGTSTGDSGDYVTMLGSSPAFYVSNNQTADADIRFECRFKISDATGCAGFIGLTNQTSNVAFAGRKGSIGFFIHGPGSIDFFEGSGAIGHSDTLARYEISSDEYIRLGFLWNTDGAAIETYINGVEASPFTVDYTTFGALAPVIEFATSTDTTRCNANVDWVKVTQPRSTIAGES